MPRNLYNLADAVTDEESFLQFILALADDWNEEQDMEKRNPSSQYGPGTLGWENGSVGTFLDAAASWGMASIHGLPDNPRTQNPWSRAAKILHAGKFYE